MGLEVSQAVGGDGASLEPRAASLSRRAWGRYRSNRLAMIGLVLVILMILAAALAPFVAPYPFDRSDFAAALQPTGSAGHLMGTDQLGRDILSRLIFGLRTALMVSLGAESAALGIALAIGLAAGYRGGRTDQFLMSFADVMYAFPTYLFAVVLVTVLGRSIFAMIVAIGVASWVTQSRLVRAQVMTLRQREYVEAARSMGAGGVTIAVRYILPNAIGPILVYTSFAIPAAIAAESGLALLGLGVQPPTPSWGNMITDGIRYVLSAPHMLLWPAVFFSTALLSFTWIGDGLRDAFDTSAEIV